jgi:phage I-like protein
MDLILAALLATAPAVDATGSAQLLPAGEFAARDGRPGNGLKWHIDDAQGARLAADINRVAAQTPIVIDYEHQTLNAERNGQAAPAAGWIRSVAWVAGRGLFAAVEWTDKARAHIAANEYRYISPVIAWDKSTGRVVGLHNAALVNHPALLGMDSVGAALAARFPSHSTETHHMERTKLIAALKLPATATDADIEAAIAKLNTDLAAKTGEAAALKTEVDAAKTGDKETLQVVKDLQVQIAQLTAARNDEALSALVDGAIAGHKFVPAHRNWLLDVGRKDLAALKQLVDTAPAIPGLQGQTGSKDPGKGATTVTAEELAVCKAMGLTAEQFKAGAA